MIDQSLGYTVLSKVSRRMPWDINNCGTRIFAFDFASKLRATRPFVVILDSEGNKVDLPVDTGE